MVFYIWNKSIGTHKCLINSLIYETPVTPTMVCWIRNNHFSFEFFRNKNKHLIWIVLSVISFIAQWRIGWSIDWLIDWSIDWRFSAYGQYFNHLWMFGHTFDLHTFLDGSSTSKILHHIRFLLLNLGFIQFKNCDKIHIINTRWATMFCGGRFSKRKLLIFLFWCVNTIVDLNSYFPCRLHRKLFCFVKCFMLIPTDLLNQLLWILWPYCDIGLWRINCECLEKKLFF